MNQRWWARLPLGALGATGVVAILLGVTRTLDVGHILVLAAVVIAITLAFTGAGNAALPRLPPVPFHTHAGGRRDLTDLSWTAVDREGRLTDRAVTRLTAALDRRTDPAAAHVRQRLAVPPPTVGATLAALAALTKETP